MNRAAFNLIIDTVAAALLMALVGTGYILWFALPPGTNRTHSLWGLLRHQYGALHFWISLALLAVLTVHVALHWRWLVTGLWKRLGAAPWAQQRPRVAGLVLLAAAAAPLTVIAVAAHESVRPLDRPLHSLEGDWTRSAGVIRISPDAAGSHAGVAAAAEHDRAAAVLAARCASCHDAVKPAGGVRADTPAALLAEQGRVPWVAVGRPNESRLFEVVGPSASSPKHRITEEDVEALRAWVSSAGR